MKAAVLIALVCCYCMLSKSEARPSAPIDGQLQQPVAKRIWQPGTYKGLITGSSTLADVLKILGKPIRKDFDDEPDDTDQVWYIYNGSGDFHGELTVAIDKRTRKVFAIFLNPENMTMRDVIDRYGKDYELKRYDFCPGFDDAEAAPAFESPDGQATYMEYPAQGIAILVNKSGAVNDIRYLKQPVGFSSVRECEEALAKRGKGRKKTKG